MSDFEITETPVLGPNDLFETEYEEYVGSGSRIIKREFGYVLENGYILNGHWVLRVNDKYIDSDRYINDLVERHNLTIVRKNESRKVIRTYGVKNNINDYGRTL